jgi:hypothetical protein
VEARDTDLGESDYQCPDGLYVAPHETQCNLYYICGAGGTPTHLYQCRDDLLFDLQYYGCNYKELVDCGDRVPFACPSPNGNFPVKEGACDSNYYVCTNGVPMKDVSSISNYFFRKNNENLTLFDPYIRLVRTEVSLTHPCLHAPHQE